MIINLDDVDPYLDIEVPENCTIDKIYQWCDLTRIITSRPSQVFVLNAASYFLNEVKMRFDKISIIYQNFEPGNYLGPCTYSYIILYDS